MYAIVKVGGKQYRVEEGGSLLVDRLTAEEGDQVTLEPLLYRSDKTVFDGADLEKVKVEAVVAGHERGKKVHVLKFKPKKGYKRRMGHRSDLTRLEVKDIKLLSRRPTEKKAGADGPKSAGKGEKPASRKPAGQRRKAEAKDGS